MAKIFKRKSTAILTAKLIKGLFIKSMLSISIYGMFTWTNDDTWVALSCAI